jgi:hypothetical protein
VTYPPSVQPTLEHLSGATLDDVTVDWRNGIVRVTFLPSEKVGEACAIRATDFTRVEVPRGGVGASRRVKQATRTGHATEILMESGETLRIESESFALDVLGG